MAQDFPTNMTPANITIVIVVGNTNEIPGVLTAVSNMYPMASFYMSNPKALTLAKQIALMEQKYQEEYDGVPTTMIINTNNTFFNERILEMWKKKKIDQKYILEKREELKKLYILPLTK